MQDLTISIIQTALHWEDKDANYEMFENYISRINEDVELIVLPEMFNTGFSMNVEKLAEEQDGPTLEWLRKISMRKGSAVCGSYIVREEDKIFNRFVFVFPDNSFKTYDKRHLFRMGDEHEYFSQGKDRVIIEYKSWKILPQICYDLRFPVWSKNNFIDREYDYDLMIYVANWPKVRNRAWKALLKARAIENQAYAAGINRIGPDGGGKDHSGDSRVIDPLGKNLCKIKAKKEGMKSMRLSFKQLQDYRKSFAVGLDWDRYKVKR